MKNSPNVLRYVRGLTFYAQAHVRKIAADAAHGPRGRAGGTNAFCSIAGMHTEVS